MLALCDMHSFSDAHESREIPIIAANLHRLMLPQQCQIWAVLRKTDDRKRLVYSLAATFLGRMCISGDLHELSAEQWNTLLEAQRLYRATWPLIKHGRSRRYGPPVTSYRHPKGWQAVLYGVDLIHAPDRHPERTREGSRSPADVASAMLVAHSFELEQPCEIELPVLRVGPWQADDAIAEGIELLGFDAGRVRLRFVESFAGGVFMLSRQAR
jgi:alpha-galactosidase